MINIIKKYLRVTKNRKFIYAILLVIVWCSGYILYFRYFGALPQATAILFQEINEPQKSDNIIVFAPHEDDESLGAGGYIARARSVGANVSIVFATDGNNRNKKIIRHQESLKAAEILGVNTNNLYYYDLPDTKLSENQNKLAVELNRTFEIIKPNIVIGPSDFDEHSDHMILGSELNKIAIKQKEFRLYSYLIHYRAYPRPQSYEPSDYLLPPVNLISTESVWLKFSLRSEELDKKNEAVLQYKSQLKTPFLHSLIMSFIRQNEVFIEK